MPRSRIAAAALLLLPVQPLGAQDPPPEEVIEARIWLDRGEEPVLQRGDQVRIYYRTAADAFVAIFHVDSDGSVTLLHPGSPDEDHWVRGGRDYRLLFPRTPYWVVTEDPGIGYYFLVASPRPFDFSSFGYSAYDRGWELTRVGRTVYQDPYLAMDDFVAALIPDWETALYGLDFISYHVGQTHRYPRFLCYDCHGFRTYTAWNPYAYACSSFRVVIWDDPYYYPAYRYAGTRVVFATPLHARPRFEVVARAVGDPTTPIVRAREAPRRTAAFKEPDAAARPQPPSRRAVPRQPAGGGAAESSHQPTRPLLRYTLPRSTPTDSRPATARGAVPGTRATPTRPGAAPETRTVPTRPGRTLTRPSGVLRDRPGTVTPERPVLQRRPPATPRGGAATRGTTGVTRPGVVRPPVSRRPSGGEPGVRPAPRPTRAIFPRPGGAVRPRGTARPPAVRRPTGGSRPAPAVGSRRPGGSGGPPAARRPGGSGARPAARRPGGSGNRPVARAPARRPGGGGSAARRGRGEGR